MNIVRFPTTEAMVQATGRVIPRPPEPAYDWREHFDPEKWRQQSAAIDANPALGVVDPAVQKAGLAALAAYNADLKRAAVYQPSAEAWKYTQGISPLYQDRMAQITGLGAQDAFTPAARAAQLQARAEQQNALAMLRDFATGTRSIARDQGTLEREALAAQIAGQVAGRAYDPAAMRGGQMAYARGAGELGAKTAIAAAQEKLAAQQALMAGAGALRGADISQFGQEAAVEKSLREWQQAKDAMGREWWKLGLGEKLAGMASAQDWEKQQLARDQWIQNMAARYNLANTASGGGGGTDWGALIGGIGTTVASLLPLLASDQRAKEIIPSGAQCKQAIANGDYALANFLESQAALKPMTSQTASALSLPSGLAPQAPAAPTVTAAAPAPGGGGPGAQQAQPSTVGWPTVAPVQRAQGIYGHSLAPVSRETPAPLPAGGGSWYQTPTLQQETSPPAAGKIARQATGLGTFTGLIFSDERCKILEDRIGQLEREGRGMTAEAAYLRSSLQGVRDRAAAEEIRAAGNIGAAAGGAVGAAPFGAAPSMAVRGGVSAASSVPAPSAITDARPDGAPEERSPFGPATMTAVGGLGRGIGSIVSALMPQSRPPIISDSGAVGGVITPNTMGGIAQSLLSDVRAKGGMGPDEKIDEFLNEIEPTQFRYKEPYASVYGAGKRTGVIAQDVAKSQLGDDMVLRDPQSGMLMLDTSPQKFNPLVLASLAHLAHRLKKVEGGR